jgi:S-adenosylmethionine hydrolase
MMISGQNLSDILESFRDFIRLELPRPEIGEDKIVCKILHVDKFGNTITNVHQSQIPADVKFFDVFHGGRYLGRIPLAGYYSSVNRGNPLLLVGGTGYLELSVSNGSAAYQFKIGVGDKLVLNYQG